MKKFFSFFKPYIFHLLILLVFTTIQVMANLKLPDYTAKIVNEGIVNEDLDLIVNTGMQMLLVALVGGFCTVLAGFLASRVAAGLARNLRNSLFEKIESFSLTEFNRFSTASLITRSTNDIQQVQTVTVVALRLLLIAPLTGVWAIIKAIDLAPEMSWIMAVSVLVILGLILIIFFTVASKFQKLQKLTDRLNLISRQSLTGIRVIRAFNNQLFETKKFKKTNKKVTDTNLYIARVMSLPQPMMLLVMNLSSIAVIWFGAHLIGGYKLEVGDMLAFMQYALQVIISFLLLSMIFILLPRGWVSAKRIAEVLNTRAKIADPKKPKDIGELKGLVQFSNVSFSYNNADLPVIDGISFSAEPGRTTAVIGSTGSGKSTAINLIPRYYDPTKGAILIDGVDIREIRQHDLREKIGYISQKAVLFSGSIRSNIAYGNEDASLERVKEAAVIAEASDFIEELPEKYDTQVSQSGKNLSGGQKQRISIARAILKDPQIYIFDDSFSALDFKTDAKLRDNLSHKLKNKTIIIIAQRINTIIDADKIIVMDKGKIVGKGRHTDLMKNCDVYKQIALSQLSKKELESYT